MIGARTSKTGGSDENERGRPFDLGPRRRHRRPAKAGRTRGRRKPTRGNAGSDQTSHARFVAADRAAWKRSSPRLTPHRRGTRLPEPWSKRRRRLYRRPSGNLACTKSVASDFATYFTRTAQAVQRCKDQQQQCSYGRDRVVIRRLRRVGQLFLRLRLQLYRGWRVPTMGRRRGAQHVL